MPLFNDLLRTYEEEKDSDARRKASSAVLQQLPKITGKHCLRLRRSHSPGQAELPKQDRRLSMTS